MIRYSSYPYQSAALVLPIKVQTCLSIIINKHV
jgi:hypothetical protein